MLTRLNINHEKFEIYAEKIHADLADGEIVPCDYTDNDIIDFCDSELAAPECGSYKYYRVIRY